MNHIERAEEKYRHTTGQDRLLAFLYRHSLTRLLLKPLVQPGVSKLTGRFLDSSCSRFLISLFLKKHPIDLNEFQKQHFASYNDFFTRKIRPELRPIPKDTNILFSPCDAKASIYPITDDLEVKIKHTRYTIPQLLANEALAQDYARGYCIILRLTVDDYHRYCYPVTGHKSPQHRIQGVLHTVNPAANDALPIYKENTREYCKIQTEQMGTMVMMEVGALMVGRICNHHKKACTVSRGCEKGFFAFGGSTIVLLVQKGVIRPEKALLRNTAQGYETLVTQGTPLGKAVTSGGVRSDIHR